VEIVVHELGAAHRGHADGVFTQLVIVDGVAYQPMNDAVVHSESGTYLSDSGL
jgi:hypothetical protein